MKSLGRLRSEWVASSHSWLSSDTRAGDIAARKGVSTPNISLSILFKERWGELGRVMYGSFRGMESIYESPSSVTI